jgi:hypothetical protein
MADRMNARTLALLLPALSALAGCTDRLPDKEAEALVRRYDELIIDAYRAGDYRVAEPVVGQDELRKLVGHIGARSDQGLTLDSRLLEFRMIGVEGKGDEAVVSTEERWTYLPRKMGSGAPAGPESTDRYLLRYHLKKVEKKWLVESVEFAQPPEVGNQLPAPSVPVRSAHGLPEKSEPGGDQPVPTAPTPAPPTPGAPSAPPAGKTTP